MSPKSPAPKQSPSECPDCVVLRRESVHAIASLRKEIDALKQWQADFHKPKCRCGKVATDITRAQVGSMSFDRATCDDCAKEAVAA